MTHPYLMSKLCCWVQVAMNAESNKIKDVFLEILMPMVDRLCKFGVFYNRELARV